MWKYYFMLSILCLIEITTVSTSFKFDYKKYNCDTAHNVIINDLRDIDPFCIDYLTLSTSVH